MLSNGPDFHIKHDDKFFSRLASKENSVANPSFRVYYGDLSGAVPFTWETRPGTPKHASFSDSTPLPPLTPPPSYYTSHSSSSTDKSTKKQPRSKVVLRSLLAKMISFNTAQYLTASPSSLSSLSSLSSSSYSSSFPGAITPSSFRRRFSSWGSSLDGEGEDYHLQMPSGGGSPKSRFCFPVRRNNTISSRNQGGNSVSVVTMKKNLLSNHQDSRIAS